MTVITLVLISAVVTQMTSNVATANVMLPVICEMVREFSFFKDESLILSQFQGCPHARQSIALYCPGRNHHFLCVHVSSIFGE